MNLRIKKSAIPKGQFGVFAFKKEIPKRRNISEYIGTKSSRPIQGDYVFKVASNKYIDGASRKNVAGYSNTCRWKNQRKDKVCNGNNATFKIDTSKNKVNPVASKKIKANEEIFTGPDFFKDQDEAEKIAANRRTMAVKTMRPAKTAKQNR